MEASDAVAQRWREMLLVNVRALTPERPAMFLSGGTDSGAVLAALLSLGIKPFCVSFTIGGRDHNDTRVARSMAETFGLDLSVVDLPRDRLATDTLELLSMLRVARKSVIQCAHPMWYMARELARNGYPVALTGMDGVIEDNRKGAVLLHDEGEEAFREYRRKLWLEGVNGDAINGTWGMKEASRLVGVKVIETYTPEPFGSYALTLNASEINRPFQKGIAYRAFPEFWKAGAWRRRNDPLNVGSGVREWHDTLLASKYNTRGLRAVAAVYRDMLRGLGLQEREEI